MKKLIYFVEFIFIYIFLVLFKLLGYKISSNLGFLIGKGLSLQDAKNKIGMVSEGINTTKILEHISIKNNIELPICHKVYEILYKGADPKKSFVQLMSRSLKKEN